jgi:hypothetical protein
MPLPHVAETNTPQPQDAVRKCSLYYEYIIRVFMSNARLEKRPVLRLLPEYDEHGNRAVI